MKYQEQHEAFKRLAIQQGLSSIKQLGQALPLGYSTPQTLVERWMQRLSKMPTRFASERRYVNRFKLGADPEFVFCQEGMRVDAARFKLQQGLAFGVDNNGRLAEIRPYPSRSALEVTASILTTLRWMAAIVPKSLAVDWVAGAFVQGDGLGGHVHFGRKRPTRDIEVRALDTIDDELIYIGAYPRQEVLRRRQGDEHRQLYGLPGDFRRQAHGYEYRSFPSWLDSPALAFLTITLSKLVVLNPELAQGYAQLASPALCLQRLKNLLAYYKEIDDDARLAFCMIAEGFPKHIGGDFKKRWGFAGDALKAPVVKFIPSSIKPNEEDVQELFTHFLYKKPLQNRIPLPTWGPLVPPEGYHMAINSCLTVGAKGLGELFWDVCSADAVVYNVENSRGMDKGCYFLIPYKLSEILPLNWRNLCGDKVQVHNSNAHTIYSSEKSRDHLTLAACRRILLETVFPFWSIATVKQDSLEQWQHSLRHPKKSRYRDKLLYGDLSSLPSGNW